VGRLDRIGRRDDVEVVYFVPPSGIGRDVARLHEAFGVFREPVAGLEPELARVEAAVEGAALGAAGSLSPQRFEALVNGARAAQSRIRAAAYRELHRDPYQPAMAASLLERVPAELDSLNEDVITAWCERLALHVETHAGGAFSIELGRGALVDSLPGVPGEASFLGTFDREQAVADERLDFFAAGHPLVEGILAHLAESPAGRVTALRVTIGDATGLGLLALYKDGPVFDAVAVDPVGRLRPEWARALSRRPLRTRRVSPDAAQKAGWATTVRRLAAALPPGREPVALAALLLGA
jgi:ATP-dependent helicase HepA